VQGDATSRKKRKENGEQRKNWKDKNNNKKTRMQRVRASKQSAEQGESPWESSGEHSVGWEYNIQVVTEARVFQMYYSYIDLW